jgi:hypothetical protein
MVQAARGIAAIAGSLSARWPGRDDVRRHQCGRASFRDAVTIVLCFVHKMRQALTFLATIKNHHRGMKTLAVISILALLTVSGAAYTDQILAGDQQTAQKAN